MSSINRRRFLTSAATAGVALGTQFRVVGANEPDAASKVIVGVMGMGGRGAKLAHSIASLPGVEVAYICDVDRSRVDPAAETLANRTGKAAPRVVYDFRRMLDDKTVDALIVSTGNHWHAPATILACAAGKHVYVEKPCSHNPREGELMLTAARKHNRQVQVGTQRRSVAHVAEAIEQIRAGELGRVYLAQSWYGNKRGTIGSAKELSVPEGLDFDLWQGPAPRRPFRPNFLHYHWHWFWHWGNGELGNNGVHYLDIIRWGLEVDYPTRVSSSGGRYRFEDDQETPDTNFVAFGFEGGKSATWEGMSCNRYPDDRGGSRGTIVHFHGEKGSLALSDSGYTVYDANAKEVRQGGPGGSPDYGGFVNSHLGNFLDAIRGKAKLNCDVEEGVKDALLCHLGNIAYRVGRSLRCRPEDGKIIEDSEAMKMWEREYEKGWEPTV